MSAATIDRTVHVDLGEHSYRIDIGRGLLAEPATFDGVAPSPSSMAALVTNEVVGSLYGERLLRGLAPHVKDVIRIEVPDGESHKTLPSFQAVLTAMLDARLDRSSLVVALGGGVIGDLAGFAAGCYQRGIAFVQVPTTLLSQVDSSVGGKTGVNHPAGKNMIGVFHQPQRVVIDLETLHSLPLREVAAGMAEVIKVAAVADDAFYGRTEGQIRRLLDRDREVLTSTIARACELKAAIVRQDEREQGDRAILNFGHTFGHAIEAALGFGTWLHGEAVGCGMVMAADLSVRLGLLQQRDADRLRSTIEAAGLPVLPPVLPIHQWVHLMRADKKATGGEMRFILLNGMGRAVVRPVPTELLRQTLTFFAATDP